jgi:BON domain
MLSRKSHPADGNSAEFGTVLTAPVCEPQDASVPLPRCLMDTDTQVFRDIAAELKNNPILYYTQLTLDVEDGVVTISGRVNSYAERKAVERAAKRVSGIRTLILEIRAAAFPVAVSNTEPGADVLVSAKTLA